MDLLFKEEESRQLLGLVNEIPTGYGFKIRTYINLIQQKRMAEKMKADQEASTNTTNKEGDKNTTTTSSQS